MLSYACCNVARHDESVFLSMRSKAILYRLIAIHFSVHSLRGTGLAQGPGLDYFIPNSLLLTSCIVSIPMVAFLLAVVPQEQLTLLLLLASLTATLPTPKLAAVTLPACTGPLKVTWAVK